MLRQALPKRLQFAQAALRPAEAAESVIFIGGGAKGFRAGFDLGLIVAAGIVEFGMADDLALAKKSKNPNIATAAKPPRINGECQRSPFQNDIEV